MLLKVFNISILIVLLASCAHDRQYPIQEVKVDMTYYLNSLKEINDQVIAHPEDLTLRIRKLFISEKLRWPENVSGDIHFLIREKGLTYEIYTYGVDFFQIHHQYENLLNLVIDWEGLEGESSATMQYKIIALQGLARTKEAEYLLWRLVQSNKNDAGSLDFVAGQYLYGLKDTTRAIYAFNLLFRSQPDHPALMQEYIPVLLATGYPDEARKVLLAQPADSSDINRKMLTAQVLYQLGDAESAHRLLRPYDREDVLTMRSEWYEGTSQWDSALFYRDRLLLEDSSVLHLLAKARICDQRGWLSSAYDLYLSVLEADSTNTIAAEGAQDVARKIAYLQRPNRPAATTPVLDIESKKATNK